MKRGRGRPKSGSRLSKEEKARRQREYRATHRDEINARRRMQNKTSRITHEANLRHGRKYRKEHHAEILAARRERWANDAKFRERELKRGRDWSARNPEKKKASWKKWADRNRDRLRERDRARSSTDAEKMRRAKMVAERRERLKSDPEYAEHVRAYKREYYHRMKNAPQGIAWVRKCLWIPKWREVCAGGIDHVKAYLKRCVPRTRAHFAEWFMANRQEYGFGGWRLDGQFQIRPVIQVLRSVGTWAVRFVDGGGKCVMKLPVVAASAYDARQKAAMAFPRLADDPDIRIEVSENKARQEDGQ